MTDTAAKKLLRFFRPAYRYVGAKVKRAQFRKEFREFVSLSGSADARFPVRWQDKLPCLNDRTANTVFDRHYVYHPAWAARIVRQINPAMHVDISSTLHFCTILSAFVPVRFYDYRPADLQLSNLVSEHADLTALPFESGSIFSLSCMHTVEHIGLGRYGDALDPGGDLKAIQELERVLAPGGSLLFVVPIGKPKIMFNAHRIYSYQQIISYFPQLELAQFALIPDDANAGGLLENASQEMADAQSYGCGCFWLRKPML
jgi:SAM-dependent methyltransferase